MHWLKRLVGTILNACGLDTTGRIGGSVQFFIYDTIKRLVRRGLRKKEHMELWEQYRADFPETEDMKQ